MKYLKLSYLSIADKLFSSIAIVIQFTVMLLIVNVLCAAINGRVKMNACFEKYLEKRGWYISCLGTDENTAATENNELKQAIDRLPDKPCMVGIKYSFLTLENGSICKLFVVPNEMLDDFNVGILDKDDDKDGAIVFDFEMQISVGDELITNYNGNACSIYVNKLLTSPAYLPVLKGWALESDSDIFFEKVSRETDEIVYAVISQSLFENSSLSKIRTINGLNYFVYFDYSVDDDYYESTKNEISRNVPNIAELSEIKDRSDEKLAKEKNKFYPLGLISVIIIVIAIVCSVAIQVLEELGNYAVLFLCGMKRSRVILISLCRLFILLLISFLISGALILLFSTNGFSAKLGLDFGVSNLQLSLAIIGLTIICSIIIPFALLRKTTPAETIRRLKND